MVLKEVILTLSILGGCGGPERSDFYQFPYLEDVVFLKEVIFNSFYFGRMLLKITSLRATTSSKYGNC